MRVFTQEFDTRQQANVRNDGPQSRVEHLFEQSNSRSIPARTPSLASSFPWIYAALITKAKVEPPQSLLGGLRAIRSPYLVALAAFGVAALFRYLLSDSLGAKVPYLQFFPAVMLAAWYGGFGPGLLCTVASALASMYFLLPPAGLAVSDPADVLSLGLFIVIGLVISWHNHRLQLAQHAQRTAAATALTRAERLDAILNPTVDGVIVIDAAGRIEAFNRGAQDISVTTKKKLSVVTSACSCPRLTTNNTTPISSATSRRGKPRSSGLDER